MRGECAEPAFPTVTRGGLRAVGSENAVPDSAFPPPSHFFSRPAPASIRPTTNPLAGPASRVRGSGRNAGSADALRCSWFEGGTAISQTIAPQPGPTAAGDLERRVADILDGLGEGFITFDLAWRITYCNRAAAAHLGLDPETALGQVIWDLVDNPPEGALRRFLARAMAERITAEEEVPSDLHPGRWLQFRVFPLHDGLCLNFRDVTERRAQAQRERAQAERLAQLESRRAFMLEVADTLRALSDPEQILAAAARLLGERLGAARTGYAQISEDGARMVILGDWSRGDVERLTGVTLSLDIFGSEALATLKADRPLLIRDVTTDPRTAAFAEGYRGVQVGALLDVPLVREGRLEAFVFSSCPEPHAWTPEDVALAEDVAARTWSALGRARSEIALRESEARFRAMADSAPAPVWVTSAAGGIEFVNRAFSELAGKSPEELMGNAWLSLMHPEDLQRVGPVREAALAELTPFNWTARFRGADGQYRWMRASSQPRFDSSGAFQGYVGIAMDVTDARRAQERQQLLINELNHRVKNTLATVQSLAHQTLREGMVTREARDRFTDRLLALSAAHNVLTRENWESAELSEIAREAVRPYNDPQAPRVLLEGPTARVAPNVALAVSMALHELATNAVKYGALSVPGGRVAVAWRFAPAGDAVELEWRETGGPPVTPPEGRGSGFGSRLLIQGLAAELGAPAELDYRPEGVVCRLRAPLAR